MRSIPLVAVLFVSTPLARPADDAAGAELKKFQGTWQLVSSRSNGKRLENETVAKIRVVIKGAKYTVHFDGKAIPKEIPFTLDPSRTPKEVTDTLPDGTEIKGIYELDGDTLRICVAPAGGDRPRVFSGKEAGHKLRVFERVKP